MKLNRNNILTITVAVLLLGGKTPAAAVPAPAGTATEHISGIILQQEETAITVAAAKEGNEEVSGSKNSHGLAGKETGVAAPGEATAEAEATANFATDPPVYPGVTTLRVEPGRFLEMVMTRNHGLAAERFRKAIADAGIKAARVVPDPELTFEGSEDVFSLELGYTIEFGRKRGARIVIAKTFARMESYEIELYANELRLAAAEAYAEAIAQAELLEVKKSSYEYMLELSRSDNLRYVAGEITENDARQSSLEAKTLLGEVYDQEGEYLSSLVILGFYAGVSADTLLVPAHDLRTSLDTAPLHHLIEQGLGNRVESELATLAVKMAQRELAAARSEQKPDVDVFIGYERDWKGFLPRKHMLTGGVTIPLKFSAINKGAVRAAGYAVDMERRQELNVRAEIEAEIASAYHIYNSAVRTYEHYLSGVMDEAAKVLEGFVYGYRAGETDILEVLIAQRTYNETREQFIESKKNAQTAALNLLYACGMGLM